MTTLTVEGMHCDACKKLIQMELDDAGLGEAVVSMTIQPDNIGELELSNTLSSDDEQKVKDVINSMDGYAIHM